MLHVQCPSCQTMVFTENHADPDSALKCGCCQEAHHHGKAASGCPGGHGACPSPQDCATWESGNRDAHNALRAAGKPVPSCPGGHCHKDIPECTSCRPLAITVIPGSVPMKSVLA